MTLGLSPYREYTDSGLAWIGLVPAHWNIGPVFSCYSPKSVKNTGMKENTVLSLSYGKLIVKPPEKLHGLVPESFETYQVVDPGDIIIRATDMQNDHISLRVGISRDRGIITSAYLCLRARARLLSEYGYLLLHAWELTKAIYGYGSGLRQNLDFVHFKRMPVPIPPLEEQEAIVKHLDTIDRRIHRFIRNRRRLIEVLNEQKQAIINRAVTRGLDPDVPLKPSGIDWVGDIPEHWQVLSLKRLLQQLIDCEHKTAPAIDQSSYRVIRTTAVRNGHLHLGGTYCTTQEAFYEWTRRGLPEAGDVIFTREAPVGEACIVPDGLQVCLGQRTVLMKLKRERYSPQFLVFMIYGGPPSHRVRLASQGSTVGHFNMDDIAAMQVLVPPLLEQESIVAAIRAQTSTLDAVITKAEREIDLIREFRTRLIADVVTGKLDVRNVALGLDGAESDDTDMLAADDEYGEETIEDAELGDGEYHEEEEVYADD